MLADLSNTIAKAKVGKLLTCLAQKKQQRQLLLGIQCHHILQLEDTEII